MTTYTVTNTDTGEIETGLTLKEAAGILVGYDERAWEIRHNDSQCVDALSRAWVQGSQSGVWEDTKYFAVSCVTKEQAETEIFIKIVKDGHRRFYVEVE